MEQLETLFHSVQVKYAVKEYACTAVDVIARRLRLAFLNTYAAYEVLDRVVDIMSEELHWSSAEKRVKSFLKISNRLK